MFWQLTMFEKDPSRLHIKVITVFTTWYRVTKLSHITQSASPHAAVKLAMDKFMVDYLPQKSRVKSTNEYKLHKIKSYPSTW